jgi:intracellular sulfur oxidation DsrE/DsrF family protein
MKLSQPIHQSTQLLAIISLLISTSLWATDFDSILAQKEAPAGVVIEIVSDEDGLLSDLLPAIKQEIKRLRQRFPDLPVAIVSHGSEQFDLTTKNQKQESTAHKITRELVTTEEVDVHVCGTHAGWYGVTPEDFPDYVDVTTAGPAQINDYESLGYELIVLPE